MEICDFFIVLLVIFVVYKIVDRLVRVPRIGRYQDRYVLITGSANGFGFEAVRRLERLGCHVFAGCRRLESVKKLKETFPDLVDPIHMDVTNRESVQAAFDYVSSKLPKDTGLWAVVNNAGIYHMLPIELVSIPMYERMLSTNLYGAIDVTMTFLPLIKKSRGRIVNVSSDAGRNTLPCHVSYCVSKYGLEAFTDGLRRSVRPFGCRAVLIEPGSHPTSLFDESDLREDFDAAWDSASVETKNSLGENFKNKALEQFCQLLKDYPLSEKVNEVIDAYEHALFGTIPRERYVVGRDAKILILIQTLPECISDKIIQSMLPQIYK